ncbi:hypothetical protein [Mycobacteroides abscessus]|uniref:hypothetical protein n=1 Tax=Mycobacteroides abscessus TaxID=36809 RepID=UPI00266FBFAF|nr:hypothetical protein [Mycobacteroides abscessus]MDO3110448.1 hypothetical protein [Mycobacteroides abscessus subsp. abscessus]
MTDPWTEHPTRGYGHAFWAECACGYRTRDYSAPRELYTEQADHNGECDLRGDARYADYFA